MLRRKNHARDSAHRRDVDHGFRRPLRRATDFRRVLAFHHGGGRNGGGACFFGAERRRLGNYAARENVLGAEVWSLAGPIRRRLDGVGDAQAARLAAWSILRQLFELATLAIFPYAVPRKTFSVHGEVDARRQYLHEGERAAEIEKAVGAAERVGDHGAGKHDGFSRDRARHRSSRLRHRVGAMRNHDAVLRRLETVLDDERAVSVRHFQAVDHHDRADGYFHPRPPQPQHLGKMSVLEVKLPGALVVSLVERAAGDEDSNGHQTESKKEKVGSRKDKPSKRRCRDAWGTTVSNRRGY